MIWTVSPAGVFTRSHLALFQCIKSVTGGPAWLPRVDGGLSNQEVSRRNPTHEVSSLSLYLSHTHTHNTHTHTHTHTKHTQPCLGRFSAGADWLESRPKRGSARSHTDPPKALSVCGRQYTRDITSPKHHISPTTDATRHTLQPERLLFDPID